MADLRIVDAPVLPQESITDDVKMPTGGLGNFSIRLGDIVWYVVQKEQLASKNYVDTSSKGVEDSLDAHIADKVNPHQVTKAQVGLGNVDNTTDAEKPVSNAVSKALLTKADKYDTYTKSETDTKISELTSTIYAGHKGYTTLALAQAAKASLPANTIVEVTSDTTTANNGVYLWDGTTLTKSSNDVLGQAKTYTDTKTQSLSSRTDAHLDIAQDKDGNVYRYTAADGSVNLLGLNGSVQSNINTLNKTANTAYADALLDIKTDAAGQIYAYTDANGVEYRFADIVINGKSVLSLEQSAAQQRVYAMRQNILSNRYTAIKTLIPIATKKEDGLIKRMPFCIKTPTGLVYFYHKQIKGYDGDSTGSELWKAIINIDANLNVTVASRELFLAPDEPRGIVKHPMLGRTSDNRIILIFEKRLETTDKYVRYLCYSEDEGLTFSAPAMVTPLGVNPAGATGNSALGTTGTITTAKNGRLIVPMYTIGGACYCIYSDDDGVTWTYSAWVDTAKVKGYEPSIILDMDNNLVMDIRPLAAGYRLKAKSWDNGATWQAMVTQPIPAAPNQGVIFRDASIGLMIQANNREQSTSRIKYSLSLSYDNLNTFPFVYMPFEPTWYGGYSQIIKWVDGIYIIAIEYADTFIGVNTNENAGLLILSIKEVLNNVNYN